MDGALPSVVEISLPTPAIEALAGMLSEEGMEFERIGAQRGVAEITELIAVAVPSLAVVALVFEKLRRLRLPRTYIRAGETLEVWVDPNMPDGRGTLGKGRWLR